MCVFACMSAGWYLPAHSRCATGVNMLTQIHKHTHKASPYQSTPTQCCWPTVCPLQSDCWVQDRGIVVWPWPDKAVPPSLFSIVCYLSTSIHMSARRPIWPAGCPALTPGPTTPVCAPSRQGTGYWACVPFVPPHIISLLIQSPQHWPLPYTLCVCMCACILFENGFISPFKCFVFFMVLSSSS